jgi:hypothetical protein
MKPNTFAVTIFSILVFVSACNRGEQVKAKIFERRETAENSLLIRYEYMIDNKRKTDSATVENMVINDDFIILVPDPQNAGKWVPDIKK